MFKVYITKTNEGYDICVDIDYAYEFSIKEIPEGLSLKEAVIEVMKKLIEKDILKSLGDIKWIHGYQTFQNTRGY